MEYTLHDIRHWEVSQGFDLKGKWKVRKLLLFFHLREFGNTFAGQKFPPLSNQVGFLLNCFDSELHREVAR